MNHTDYMAHGYCLLWKPWLVGMHVGSDVLIALAYFAIPLAIWLFLQRRPELDQKGLAYLFAAFILLCGVTHALQAVTLWWPIYETQGFAKVATAAVSLATAFIIFPLIQVAAALPAPEDLKRINAKLTDEVAAHNETLNTLRETQAALERRVEERTRELDHARRRYEALVKASAQIVWAASPDGQVVEDSPTWRGFTGQSYAEWTGAGWLDALHPEDRERAKKVWLEAVQRREMYEIDYRILHTDGHYRWTTARAVPLLDDDGAVTEWVGMNEDISERKRREDHEHTLLCELSHRTKNLLAVIQSIAQRTFKGNEAPQTKVDTFIKRLHGLSVSHDLLVRGDWSGASLEDLTRAHLQPFTVHVSSADISVSGPKVLIKAEAAQHLGLALHELATNAAKYGALSGDGSQLNIAWDIVERDGETKLALSWLEPESRPCGTDRKGFGHLLLERIVAASLLGECSYEIDAEDGLSWRLIAPLTQVQRSARS